MWRRVGRHRTTLSVNVKNVLSVDSGAQMVLTFPDGVACGVDVDDIFILTHSYGRGAPKFLEAPHLWGLYTISKSPNN